MKDSQINLAIYRQVCIQLGAFFVGQKVKYSHPQPGEEKFIFTLIEINGDRVKIRDDDPHYRIKPIEVVHISEIKPA